MARAEGPKAFAPRSGNRVPCCITSDIALTAHVPAYAPPDLDLVLRLSQLTARVKCYGRVTETTKSRVACPEPCPLRTVALTEYSVWPKFALRPPVGEIAEMLWFRLLLAQPLVRVNNAIDVPESTWRN